LLDLDETLYLRNSTEDFLESARPRSLVIVLLRLLEALRPWRLTGGASTRDVWRVRLVAACFPGTARRWQQRVLGLAAAFSNQRLLAALHRPGLTPIITTIGFGPIVRPLVAAIGWPQAQIVSARLNGFADRRGGKLPMVLDALGDDVVRRALVLTDSAQDLGLLDACARPLRAVWPEALAQRALGRVYWPGAYLSQVKRPGESYIFRAILQEDYALWVLSSVALAGRPLLHVLGLLALLLSFWVVYERGYVDNDRMALRFEAEPKLSAAYAESTVPTPRWQPWGWAALSGALALVLLRWPQQPSAADGLVWLAVLLATHFVFRAYNRLDKGTRVWWFVALQFARSAAFVAVVPVTAIGAMALGAHVLAKWVPYHVYRLGGKAWPAAPFHLIRLMFYAVLALLLAFASGPGLLFSGTALVLLLWNLFRARRELTAAWRSASRIDRNPARPTAPPSPPP
jgi:hypothetical protein